MHSVLVFGKLYLRMLNYGNIGCSAAVFATELHSKHSTGKFLKLHFQLCVENEPFQNFTYVAVCLLASALAGNTALALTG